MKLNETYKLAVDNGIELFHPNFHEGKFILPKDLQRLSIPFPLLSSELWDVRKPKREISGETLETEARIIVEKYLDRAQATALLNELKTVLFTPKA